MKYSQQKRRSDLFIKAKLTFSAQKCAKSSSLIFYGHLTEQHFARTATTFFANHSAFSIKDYATACIDHTCKCHGERNVCLNMNHKKKKTFLLKLNLL